MNAADALPTQRRMNMVADSADMMVRIIPIGTLNYI
jgi:hypothetical protein